METLVSSLDLLRGRRVLITGHTGFKGAWLSKWLIAAGAEVFGIALPPSTEPSLYSELHLSERMRSTTCDVRDALKLAAQFHAIQPEVVFHLAAQAIVKSSYRDPVATFTTNVSGSVNVLDAVRRCDSTRALVLITSDKCYRNLELDRGYHEEDELGGTDPYSASKAAAELIYHSYAASFLNEKPMLGVASARAGNVIGGGDWSADRLIPDCVRALESGQPIELRKPQATRPWQHVLEPLSGYIMLAGNLLAGEIPSGESWNFGPPEHDVHTVFDVANRCVKVWGSGMVTVNDSPTAIREATLLQLNCTKASLQLGWKPRWDYQETVERTMMWYRLRREGRDVAELVANDIKHYLTR